MKELYGKGNEENSREDFYIKEQREIFRSRFIPNHEKTLNQNIIGEILHRALSHDSERKTSLHQRCGGYVLD